MCASSRTKGYLTVFLSLTITLIMSLILALFQGARIGAVKMKTECVADIAMNSVLAEYNRQLYEQYGLLMVDTSYGRANPSIVNTREHLRHYVQKNFDRSTAGRLINAQTITSMYCEDVDITGSSFATDNDFSVFARQILAYMGADPVEGLMTDVLGNADMVTGNALDSTDVEAMAAANQEAIDSVELPTVINEEGEEEQITLGNPADTVNSQKGVGALGLAVKNPGSISAATVNIADLPSHRKLNKGTGLRDYEDISASEKLLIEQYFYEKCSRYGQELEKSQLKYQLEYLIFGQDSDYRNLEKMAGTLLFWREASNMIYLFNNPAKCAEAEAVAAVLTAVLLVPELLEPVKYSILFAWTFAESISDLNILFSGGRVPILKSDATWRLSLVNMLDFRDHLNGGDLGEGLYYEDYLRIRLLLSPFGEKLRRMGDVVEMDVRRSAGNRNFRLDYCLDTFCAEISVATTYGYDVKIERVYGYEE
ncbi:DUF5702 domain-containing protein [Butyrivibrio sp. FCS014]|uniref:DUF5702 domain-containing protein n=1 Tax=Butyrivibrio sp. FCS014 TaxID=1408304 RepID=UPI0004B78791|nr:DUF5702 domain-containing protein [Butyrivibrio sp. FCS014]